MQTHCWLPILFVCSITAVFDSDTLHKIYAVHSAITDPKKPKSPQLTKLIETIEVKEQIKSVIAFCKNSQHTSGFVPIHQKWTCLACACSAYPTPHCLGHCTHINYSWTSQFPAPRWNELCSMYSPIDLQIRTERRGKLNGTRKLACCSLWFPNAILRARPGEWQHWQTPFSGARYKKQSSFYFINSKHSIHRITEFAGSFRQNAPRSHGNRCHSLR